MVARMLRSLRRWAQPAVVVLAAALVATVVAFFALQRHPKASLAVHDAVQLQMVMPTLAPLPTLAPQMPLDPIIAQPNINTTPEPVTTSIVIQTAMEIRLGKTMRFVWLCYLAVPLLCITLQLCCYFRSKHEPADIEEGLTASPQIVNEDLWRSPLLLTQVVKLVEMCGCEARNTYLSGDGNFYIDEKSDCAQRLCTSVNRELTLFGHAGPSEETPVVLRMFKPFHVQGCCCCCRPEMRIDMPMGDKMVDVGRIEDPFRCCAANQMVFDSNNELRYEVTGTFCQCGVCCPCLADFHFDINDQHGESVGTIFKKQVTCEECFLHSNRFEVHFPTQCTMEEKRLLVGSAMLLDLQYFEQNKSRN